MESNDYCSPCNKYFSKRRFSKAHRKTFDHEISRWIFIRDQDVWCVYCKVNVRACVWKSHELGDDHLRIKKESVQKCDYCGKTEGVFRFKTGDVWKDGCFDCIYKN